MNFLQIFIFFIIYSFFGWVCEVIYCSIPAKKFINRGFLYGPLCPIYGVGALFVQFSLARFSSKYAFIPIVFLIGMIGTTIIEYLTSYWMERVFHLRWWDYSDYKYNINGRVCLKNSIQFGVMSVAMVYLINPFVVKLINHLTVSQIRIFAYSLMIIFLIDLLITLFEMFHFKNILAKFVSKISETIKDTNDDSLESNYSVNHKYDSKFSHHVYGHLMKRYPMVSSKKYHTNLQMVKKHFDEQIKINKEEHNKKRLLQKTRKNKR